jgi:hypothetical protein
VTSDMHGVFDLCMGGVSGACLLSDYITVKIPYEGIPHSVTSARRNTIRSSCKVSVVAVNSEL